MLLPLAASAVLQTTVCDVQPSRMLSNELSPAIVTIMSVAFPLTTGPRSGPGMTADIEGGPGPAAGAVAESLGRISGATPMAPR